MKIRIYKKLLMARAAYGFAFLNIKLFYFKKYMSNLQRN